MKRLTKWCEEHQEWQENHDNDIKGGWKNGYRACMNKLAEYENAEEQGLLVNVSKMKCLNCLYRSQYCDSENRYGCGGLHGTEFYVQADYFCAEFEPRITEVETLQTSKESGNSTKDKILMAIKWLEPSKGNYDDWLHSHVWTSGRAFYDIIQTSLVTLQEQLERLENKQVTCEECKYHCDRDGKHRCVRLNIYPEYSDFYCSFGELK